MSQSQAIIEQAKQRILLLDGGMGTMIQEYKYEEADYRGEHYKDWHCDIKGNNDILVITKPDVIKTIHLDYLKAGADILETNTFNATSISLADYDMQSEVKRINTEAVKVAKQAVEEMYAIDSSRPRYVAGVLGPTSRTASISPDVNDPGKRNVSFDELVVSYKEATEALVTAGADLILVETIFDTLNAKAAVFAVMEVFDELEIQLPIMISGTITDASGRTLSGQTTEAFYNSMRHSQAVAFGLNCALGPDLLRQYVAELSRVSETLVTAHPNAGLPNEFGEYDMGPEEMAEHIGEWARSGLVNIVGGCCGSTPEHIKAIAQSIEGVAPRKLVKPETKMRLAGLEPFTHA